MRTRTPFINLSFVAYSLQIDTPESLNVLFFFFTTNVSTLISYVITAGDMRGVLLIGVPHFVYPIVTKC